MNTYLNLYNQSPQSIKNFINSDDYFNFFDECVKKFEIDDDTQINFDYLIQDISIKFFEPESVGSLAIEITKRLNFEQEKSSQIAHYIWTRFKPLVIQVWKNAETFKKDEEESREEIFKDIIKQARAQSSSPKNIVDLGKVARQSLPQKPEIQTTKPVQKPVNLRADLLNPKIVQIPQTPAQKIGSETKTSARIKLEDKNESLRTQPIPDTELESGIQNLEFREQSSKPEIENTKYKTPNNIDEIPKFEPKTENTQNEMPNIRQDENDEVLDLSNI